jgi:hypothetical protein
MSRTHRRIAPNREYQKEKWYKHQEERRLGKGVWMKSVIRNKNSSNRVKARIAAQQKEGLVEKHHEAQH